MSDIALLAHLAPRAGDRAERPDGATGAGPGRHARRCWTGSPGARARARAHAWKLIEATPGGIPVAGDRREDPDRLGRHRHGRDPGHRPLGQGRGGSHLEERLRLPPAGRVVPEHPRVPGDAAPPRERRLEHLHRPPGSAGRRHPAGPCPVPAQGPGPRRRRRRQPRAHQAPAVPGPPRGGRCCSPAAG